MESLFQVHWTKYPGIMFGNVRGEENGQERKALVLYGNSNSDWNPDIESRRSTSGHTILCRGGLVG